MTSKISRRAARGVAARLEIDRAIVARRLSGGGNKRAPLSLPSHDPTSISNAHPSPAAHSLHPSPQFKLNQG
jgi:hypothetical protein